MSSRSIITFLDVLTFLFCVWMFTSSQYYVTDLFTGKLGDNREFSIFFQALKYGVAILFSLGFLFLSKRYTTIFLISFFLFVLFLFSPYVGHFDFGSLDSFNFYFIFLSMIGLMTFFSLLTDRHAEYFNKCIIISGLILAFLSYVELFVISDRLYSYWKNTEGVRSVSALLNPNNFGLYLGAVLLLICTAPYRMKTKFLLIIPMLYPFFMTGSRTAWISTLLLMFVSLVVVPMSRRSRLLYILVVSGISMVVLIFIQMLIVFGVDLPERMTNFETAFLRLYKYGYFLSQIPLFPDVYSRNRLLVSESAYFMATNYFGISGILTLSLFLFLGFRQRKYLAQERQLLPWRLIFIYYCFAGFFENVLGSFPNNQLFFISAGSIFILRDVAIKRSVLEGG